MKRIKKPNYNLTSPADLRTLLRVSYVGRSMSRTDQQDHGLPTHGDKDAIITRVQDWILLYNSNLDTSQPRSLPSLRARLAETEASRKRDEDKGRLEAVEELKTVEGRSKYAHDKRSEFERLKQEIVERDKRRKMEEKGAGVDSAIEIE
jgi:E3 ubiquitin-protein ligase RAD18